MAQLAPILFLIVALLTGCFAFPMAKKPQEAPPEDDVPPAAAEDDSEYGEWLEDQFGFGEDILPKLYANEETGKALEPLQSKNDGLEQKGFAYEVRWVEAARPETPEFRGTAQVWVQGDQYRVNMDGDHGSGVDYGPASMLDTSPMAVVDGLGTAYEVELAGREGGCDVFTYKESGFLLHKVWVTVATGLAAKEEVWRPDGQGGYLGQPDVTEYRNIQVGTVDPSVFEQK
jgi:hypothetical protein